MILLIDNYDSFVHNLARYLQRLGQPTLVVRNDAMDVQGVRAIRPAAIILSPGPCTPNEAGCSLDIVRELHRDFPMLGVCLGHQTIAAAFGGRIVRAGEPLHGRASRIEHAGQGIFQNLPSPLMVGRYHSLIAEEASLPQALEITARATDGTIMALAHRSLPIHGVQFHPESILTEHGYGLLANFLRIAKIDVGGSIPSLEDERIAPKNQPTIVPSIPVTF